VALLRVSEGGEVRGQVAAVAEAEAVVDGWEAGKAGDEGAVGGVDDGEDAGAGGAGGAGGAAVAVVHGDD